MNIEKIVEVFVPPSSPVRMFTLGPITLPSQAEKPPLIISREDPLRLKVTQDGQTHRLLLPETEEDAVQNQEVAVWPGRSGVNISALAR